MSVEISLVIFPSGEISTTFIEIFESSLSTSVKVLEMSIKVLGESSRMLKSEIGVFTSGDSSTGSTSICAINSALSEIPSLILKGTFI